MDAAAELFVTIAVIRRAAVGADNDVVLQCQRLAAALTGAAMIFGQTPEYVRADAIDMNMYESREELLNACHETVLKEIERMKKSHE